MPSNNIGTTSATTATFGQFQSFETKARWQPASYIKKGGFQRGFSEGFSREVFRWSFHTARKCNIIQRAIRFYKPRS